MTKIAIEIEKVFMSKDPEMWGTLISSQLLSEAIGRDLAREIVNCPQISKWHPEGSLSNHIDVMFKNAVEAVEEDIDIYWGILLHDCMKWKCLEYHYDEKGIIERTSFHGHDVVGARKAMEILVDLEMDVKRIKKIVWLISQHMRIAQISKMKTSKVEELVNHKWIKELMRLHNYDDMLNEVSPDCIWIENYLR